MQVRLVEMMAASGHRTRCAEDVFGGEDQNLRF
jgi:hypothetical protein